MDDPVQPTRAADVTGDARLATSSPEALPTERPAGPWRSAWRVFRRHRIGMAGLVILVLLYGLAIFADLIAPYAADDQNRDLQWSAPTTLRFRDANGFSWRPFIHPVRNFIDETYNVRQEEDTTQRCYMRIFPIADRHTFLGLFPIERRLFGFDPPQQATNGDTYYARYYLVGGDVSGRDVFSRIVYGSWISMTIGICGAGIVLVIGLVVGGVSGYLGGKADVGLMTFCEALMLLPGFYLLLMLRNIFPPGMSSVTVYFAVILIMALISWPGLARVIRGMVMSIREEPYVQAARSVGAGPWRIIFKHLLPNTTSYVVVSVTLSIPGYILGESALSILGLGIVDPTPSWGNMLQKAMEIAELDSHPWILAPGVFILLAVMGFNLVGDGMRDALDPRARNRD